MNLKPETRKEEIILIAAKLFKEKGYSAVTMRDLAAAIGIKAASLYNHISSKQDILEAIVIDMAEGFTDGMEVIISSEENTIAKLTSIIHLHVDLTVSNPYKMATLNADWVHLEAKKAEYFRLRTIYENHFRAILKEAIKNGEIEPVEIDVILFSILTTLRSLYLWIPKKEQLNILELKNNLVKVLLKGIITD